jgi:hypothetical protein
MAQIKYVGSAPAVDVPDLGLTVAQGEVIDVDDDRAAEMSTQDCWDAVTAKAAKAAASTPSEG